MDVHCLIAHVTNYDFVLVIVLAACLASLTIRALPLEALHEFSVQWWLMAGTVIHSVAPKAF